MENWVPVPGGNIFVRHNKISSGKKTMLFVHGIGGSGLSFREAFENKKLDCYNLLALDMLGHGRSTMAEDNDYTYATQVKRLWSIVDFFSVKKLIVVGHSLGGDVTTMFCSSDKNNVVQGYVNVEGDITQYDVFVSNRAVAANEQGRFQEWLRKDFILDTVLKKWGEKYDSCRRYYACLNFCRPEAFLANAQELVFQNFCLEGKYKSQVGKTYTTLAIPKVFCYGTESITKETLEFAAEHQLQCQKFEAFHWIMNDQPEKFYSFLLNFCSEL